MNKNADLYVCISWPEIQDFMEHEDYPSEVGFDADKNIWFVPKSMYDEVMNK